jgi:hypothetical protein
MKNLVVFLIFVVVLATNQVAFGQSAQEKKKMNLIEKEISRLEKELFKAEKKFEKEKNLAIFKLKKDLKVANMQSDPKRAREIGDVAWAQAEFEVISSKIDSISLISSNSEIDDIRLDIEYYQTQKEELISAWISQDNTAPRELSIVSKNRRQRANFVRREELVLSKIEGNINQQIDGGVEGGGYKVIFDNKYSLNTTFILRSVDGGERLAVSLAPRTKERHYVIPGRYLVESVVGGRKSLMVHNLTVDGEMHYYETEPCFGFVSKDRY